MKALGMLPDGIRAKDRGRRMGGADEDRRWRMHLQALDERAREPCGCKTGLARAHAWALPLQGEPRAMDMPPPSWVAADPRPPPSPRGRERCGIGRGSGPGSNSSCTFPGEARQGPWRWTCRHPPGLLPALSPALSRRERERYGVGTGFKERLRSLDLFSGQRPGGSWRWTRRCCLDRPPRPHAKEDECRDQPPVARAQTRHRSASRPGTRNGST